MFTITISAPASLASFPTANGEAIPFRVPSYTMPEPAACPSIGSLVFSATSFRMLYPTAAKFTMIPSAPASSTRFTFSSISPAPLVTLTKYFTQCPVISKTFSAAFLYSLTLSWGLLYVGFPRSSSSLIKSTPPKATSWKIFAPSDGDSPVQGFIIFSKSGLSATPENSLIPSEPYLGP